MKTRLSFVESRMTNGLRGRSRALSLLPLALTVSLMSCADTDVPDRGPGDSAVSVMPGVTGGLDGSVVATDASVPVIDSATVSVDAASPAVDASAADAGGDTGTSAPPLTAKCEGGSLDACSSFVTASGTEVPLGKYGSIMETNQGAGFENTVNILDNNTVCATFASSFGQDKAQTDKLLDLKDNKLTLYTVYRPANWLAGETYPVVTWGNGTCAQPEGYGALLRFVASHGFFVVAANSRYVGSGNEQKRGIDFALKANADPASPYYQRLDASKVAAMGHSQGGSGTVAAASDPRINTVILFNGGNTASKPFLSISGDRDLGGRMASTMKTAVDAAPKAAYLFYHMVPGTGSSDGHLTLMTQPERVTGPTLAWLKYLLQGDAESKDWFVGASCKLCGHAAEYEFGQKGL